MGIGIIMTVIGEYGNNNKWEGYYWVIPVIGWVRGVKGIIIRGDVILVVIIIYVMG